MKNKRKKRHFILTPPVIFIIISLFTALLLPLTSCQAGGNSIEDFFSRLSFFEWVDRDNDNEISGAETAKEIEETGKEQNQNEQDEKEGQESSAIMPEEKTNIKIWIDDVIPQNIRTKILQQVNQIYIEVEETTRNEAGVIVELIALPDGEDGAQSEDKTESEADIYWVLAPVISFFTVCDEIQWDDFLNFWSGNSGSLNYLSGGEAEINLILTAEVYNVLKKCSGNPLHHKLK
jgi:hypothetical protein